MTDARRFVTAADPGLLTDRYELSMLQAYWPGDMRAEATFSLYFRKMRSARRFMLACGQQHAAQPRYAIALSKSRTTFYSENEVENLLLSLRALERASTGYDVRTSKAMHDLRLNAMSGLQGRR